MSDDLLKNLQKLYESNERRFNAPIKESYDEFDNEPPELDDQDGGDQETDELPPDATAGSGEEEDAAPIEGSHKPKEELPPESHPDVFPQPAASKGILFLNPKAIPNDYGKPTARKGHIVNVLKKDTSKEEGSPTVRENGLKLGAVKVPFSIIKQDESGRKYVTREDINKIFNKPSYVYSLLKLQPIALDRWLDKDEKNRKQWKEPAPSDTSDVTAQPGTPEYYNQVNKVRAKNGLPPIPQSQMKMKKETVIRKDFTASNDEQYKKHENDPKVWRLKNGEEISMWHLQQRFAGKIPGTIMRKHLGIERINK